MIPTQLASTAPLRRGLLRLCQWLCRRLTPREIGTLFERLQISLADDDPRVGRYALEFNNPQALCFLIDAYPTLQRIFATYPRMGTVHLLDIGPAFGASAGLLSQMHRSHFLGPRIVVDALDISDSRRRFIEMTYPLVNFLHASIESLPGDAMWDVVYCSNAIEHIDDPRAFVHSVMKHTRGRAVFLAPYKEALPLSQDHRSQITEQTFEGFEVESAEVISSAAWPTTAEGVERQQILVVLAADASQGAPGRAVPARGASGDPGVARHWDRFQATRDRARDAMTDWGDHPEVLRLLLREVLDSEAADLVEFLELRCAVPKGRALSLCCGDGAFEKSLLAHGVFQSIEGIDIAPARVEAACAGVGEYAGRLSFKVGDVEAGQFGSAQYDAVLAKASLHHVGKLEGVLEGIARSLAPDGRLVTIDFFGPTRFQWTERQLAEANRFLDDEVPAALRLRADGTLYRATRPSIQDMIDLDPSEAVRSGELYGLLKSRFELESDYRLGGTLLSLILHGEIINNFDPDNAAHNALVRKAFERERELIDRGEIDSDFRLIVARPK